MGVLRNWRLRTKIGAAFAAVAVGTATILLLLFFFSARDSIEQESFNKLTAVREMKASQIEDEFDTIRNQLLSQSENLMTIEALDDFARTFHEFEQTTEAEVSETDPELAEYYEDQFLPRLRSTPSGTDDVDGIEPFWPESPGARALQNLYISSNPERTGQKELLDTADDGSEYSSMHARYHPVFRQFLDRSGYHDLFLIDMDGDIVYTVFKETDFATSLIDGPYADTNLAEVFRAARGAARQGPDVGREFYKAADFSPYAPSYQAPAAFAATPVFDGEEPVGVLALQMPIDRVNDIMTNREEWSRVGLGDSGETYLVADDFTMRNQSRFLIEDRDGYFAALVGQEDIPSETIRAIDAFDSTIGLQPVKTEGTGAALDGETGEAIFPDYRGVPVLSSYGPLGIEGVKWAILSEIDEAEAFRAVEDLWTRALALLAGGTIVVLGAATLFSRSLTRPLRRVTQFAGELARHDFTDPEPLDARKLDDIAQRGDEVGQLARASKTMQEELQESVQRLVETTRVQEQMQRELDIAREIQMSMLSLTFPDFPDQREFSLFADVIPAREVGGDYYDFGFVDDDHFMFCLGDVSGKGVPAALFMAVAKTMLKSSALSGKDPARVMSEVNAELSADNPECMFATTILGVLNVRNGNVVYTNAGHNPPYVMGDGGVVRLDDRHGVMIGPIPGAGYDEGRFRLEEGETLVLYTDGITEATDQSGAMFGDDRLERLLKGAESRDSHMTVRTAVDAVKSFEGEEQADDITVLALQFFGSKKLSLEMENDLDELARVSEEFIRFAQAHHIPEAVAQRVHIALDDLLANVVVHAFGDGDGEHRIDVEFDRTGQNLSVWISDDGAPFNPLDVPEPDVTVPLEERQIGGLGIHLAKSLIDDFHYERRNDRNVVRLLMLVSEGD